MRSLRLALALVLPVLLLGGCVHVTVTRQGDRFPPYPEDCKLEFRYGDLGKAMALVQSGYVQVGAITVVDQGDSFDAAMKARVRPYACRLGGQVVMMTSSSPGSFTTNYPYASLAVFRKVAVQKHAKAPAQGKPGVMGI